MQEMIDERRRAEKKPERHDLFSSLLDANSDEVEGQARLSDEELTGDIFTFLLAGHEVSWCACSNYRELMKNRAAQTTAHTLCFTFSLLALYSDQQEILYKKIMEVLPDKRLPVC